jgi:Spy/CpxP family protein refolding chaperone
MRRDLNLTGQQATEIRAILDQTRNDYRALRSEVRPRYDAVRQNARTRIRALLSPEQQKLFDAKAAERDARRDEHEK